MTVRNIQVNSAALTTLGSVFVMALTLGSAQAHQTALEGDIEVGDGYVVNGDGLAIKTGDGECLLGSDACLGIEKKAALPEPEPEPIPEPTKSKVVSSVDISGAALFAHDSDTLSDEGLAAIQDVIRQATSYQGVTEIEIIGHTDSTGPAEYNQALSERRAEAVKSAFGKAYPDVNIIELAESAPDIKLVATGMGESQPIADNETRDGRAKNRRVEILIKAKDVKFK